MKKYFLLKNGQQVGPFSIDDLKLKKIKKTNLVWAEGMADWLKAGEIAEFKTLFTVTAPPPPKMAAPPPPPAAPQYQVPPAPPQEAQAPQYQAPSAPPQQAQAQQYQAPPAQQNYNYAATPPQQNGYTPKPGGGWVIAGYIFSIMGGLIGIAIGGYLKGKKEKLPNGVKVKKFDDKAQKNGLIIIIISAISWVFWMQMNK